MSHSGKLGGRGDPSVEETAPLSESPRKDCIDSLVKVEISDRPSTKFAEQTSLPRNTISAFSRG